MTVARSDMHKTEDSRTALAPSVADAVAPALVAGEHVVAAADCMRKLHVQLFERATVVTTNQRLMVVSPAFPWGHTVRAKYPLGDCKVANGKERIDGSRLLIIDTGSGTLCLYFSRGHREGADWIVESVGLAPNPNVARPDPDALALELSALSEPAFDEDD